MLNEREKERKKWREDEEEDVSSYWMTLMKGEDTRNWKRKHQNAFCGEVALEEAMNLLRDRLHDVDDDSDGLWAHQASYPIFLLRDLFIRCMKLTSRLSLIRLWRNASAAPKCSRFGASLRPVTGCSFCCRCADGTGAGWRCTPCCLAVQPPAWWFLFLSADATRRPGQDLRHCLDVGGE